MTFSKHIRKAHTGTSQTLTEHILHAVDRTIFEESSLLLITLIELIIGNAVKVDIYKVNLELKYQEISHESQ